MFRALFIGLSLLFAMPLAAHAEVSKEDQKAIDAKVSAFFSDLNANKTDAAMQALFLPKMQDKKMELQTLTSQLNFAMDYTSRPVKYALMAHGEKADILVYRSYVVYSDQLPFKFTFVFFKTTSGWYAQSMNFSDVSPSDVSE